MQINTQKTKVMAFFETPSLQKARGGQHRPGQSLPPFHIHAPFPIPCTHLITEVLQFEYLGLILDPKLTMHLATTEAIRRAAHGQSLTQAVSYSLRYDKKRSQLTPTQSLGLWKSAVLPHFLQNLRYIQSTTDVTKLQTSLNLSLARALHVYGDHTALLADAGVPPLYLIQYTHLAQFHFRLTKTNSDTLPATFFKTFNKSLALHNLHPSTLDYHIRNSLYQLHIDPLIDPLPHMITLPPKYRERAYRNILRTTISTLWRMELLNLAPLHLPHNDCRKTSYIHIARDDLHRRDLFKPAQYLRSHLDQLPLLRLRTQATSYIPSHLHLSNDHTYIPYDQRHCPCCLPIQIVGNELHTLLHCPHSSHLFHPTILSFTRALRRFDLCSWSSHTPLQQTAILLGSRPPKLFQKKLARKMAKMHFCYG